MEEVFLEHLSLIERATSFICRRAEFSRQDCEDFTSSVQVKLIDNDYAVLRKHRGESKVSTYLTTVIQNLFKDFCNHKLGKFRPSAAAKKLGKTAEALERLLVRDQYDLEAAINVLRRSQEVSAEELRELAARLPIRHRRRFVDEEVLETHSSTAPDADPEERVVAGEKVKTAARVEEVLGIAMATLPSEDLLILKMRYRDGLSIATIASILKQKPRRLYTRHEKSLAQLEKVFKEHGLTWNEVREILGWQEVEIRTPFGDKNGEK